ncbi:biotin-independent malonate decarboxylase subunit gamma [Roseospira marina]|uniref:Biotin-independent malonate decarboxylase subunit gamma n=1 Tax=Roseospira marina TaxID=140057 RepID=A0A5M6IDI8_9PROT|nr:biotin-independent malonate decarboxylase subunit gamma [Roseospira marina]KAA5606132.1 biotin-independent malonate decarboxylase subunit gamma [Roseospira marina]MBB4314270.1 malonate decarboxylase gamma subunit [Roseospira marina]MBB5087430.1 malonate decarboxylase gamma subunit [Roseospira marina]
MDATESMMGRGREAIDMIVDPESFTENAIGAKTFDDPDFGPCAAVGTATLDGQTVTIIASDGQAFNERFPVVYAGIIGMEEGYKMAQAVYASLEADADKPKEEKRPLVLIVDTPGNGPGKVEEIFGMNKATGAYQLALAEARLAGHPIIAMVIGRAISGAFLCHGLQADNILSLDASFGTMIHVMPLTSVSRIIRKDLEVLEELSKSNPVFAAGPQFFYALGGVEELVDQTDKMRAAIIDHIATVRAAKAAGQDDTLGPWGRGALGAERDGRVVRPKVMDLMNQEFAAVAGQYAPQR